MLDSGFKERFIQLTRQPYGWAKQRGVSHGTITSILENRRPQPKTIRKIVELTGCSEAWLVHGIGEMYPDTLRDGQAPHDDDAHQRTAGVTHQAPDSSADLPTSAAPIGDSLVSVIMGVEAALGARGLVITPEKKAEVIALVYDLKLRGVELTPDQLQRVASLAI